MRRKSLSLTDQLRQAIDRSDMSRYRICKIANMSEATMSRFMSGKGGLSLDMLDKIAATLGVNLVIEATPDDERDG